ncbi:TM2 domain-containing protein 1 isoform X2 [Sarcophilus harrisii]|uniref:TM2 domain-containing protein 1 isoform X2 n=1 Tax=Sarcophilus harrisii TaxID=9305 RepID=UPI0013020A2F|nr:TM2 domain-containing protein 1 isoform X2 [Sarcophilus harrisii]
MLFTAGSPARSSFPLLPQPPQKRIKKKIIMQKKKAQELNILDPEINEATQEPVNCTNYTAHVSCYPAPNVTCKDFSGNETHFTGSEVGFFKTTSCRNVNGYSYRVAVALSLFLGWLGADRFYLGYPALGLLKFCTVGFCGIGSLIDFILISMQIVGPSDGTSYIIDYYGTRLTRLSITNETFRKTQKYP